MDKVFLTILLVIALSLIGVVGDFFIKLSGAGPEYIKVRWFILGFLIYASTAIGWFYAMKHLKLSTLGVFYAISTVLFLTIIAVVYFKESLNAYEIVGILLAIASLVLLGRFA